MNNPIKHHYVPQCYLRKFSIDKDRTKVKYYDKQLHICAEQKISDICQIENLYTLSRSEPYDLETNFFANNIEDKLGKMLSWFEQLDCIMNKISYDKNHRKNLSRQIVLQYMRTPKYRDIKSKNELNAYYKRIELCLQKLNFEVEEIEYKVENKAEFHKTILSEEDDEVISGILEADWELLYNSSGDFYTSDNPVAIIERKDMPVTYCEAIKYFSEIFYPLNSKLVLHIIAQNPSSIKTMNMSICEGKELYTINNLIANNAVRYIFYTHQFN